MKIVIGGSFQGKEAFARTQFDLNDWEDGATCELDRVLSCEGMHHFHEYIKRCLQEKGEVSNLAEKIIEKNPNLILVCNEVGYGVVPMEAFAREYREAVGRTMTKLVAFSDEVYRVTCGVGVKIK